MRIDDNDDSVDLLVIGGGICGLVHAYERLKMKGGRVMLLEKAGVLGGRCRQIKFGGVLVPGGAGIGRLCKDRKLFRLVSELTGERPQPFQTNIGYYNVKEVDVLGIVENLKGLELRTDQRPGESFADFFVRHKGQGAWEDFCDASGYTDFQSLSVHDALYNYGFDDVVTGGKKFKVPWNDLVDILERKIEETGGRILKKTTVGRVLESGHVELSNGKCVTFRDFVLCVPPKAIRGSCLMDLLNAELRTYVSHVHGQSFCYVYATVKGQEFVDAFRTYTVVPRPLQKIIPMSKGVYMVAYADNDSADYLQKHVKTSRDLERLVREILGIDIHVRAMRVRYWSEGTHYRDGHGTYKYCKHLKGEAFALNQGWTNGGLLT